MHQMSQRRSMMNAVADALPPGCWPNMRPVNHAVISSNHLKRNAAYRRGEERRLFSHRLAFAPVMVVWFVPVVCVGKTARANDFICSPRQTRNRKDKFIDVRDRPLTNFRTQQKYGAMRSFG